MSRNIKKRKGLHLVAVTLVMAILLASFPVAVPKAQASMIDDLLDALSTLKRVADLSNSQIRFLTDLGTKVIEMDVLEGEEKDLLKNKGLSKDDLYEMADIFKNLSDQRLNQIRTGIKTSDLVALDELLNEVKAELSPQFRAELRNKLGPNAEDTLVLTFIDLAGITIEKLEVTNELKASIDEILEKGIYEAIDKETLSRYGVNWVNFEKVLNQLTSTEKDKLKAVLQAIGAMPKPPSGDNGGTGGTGGTQPSDIVPIDPGDIDDQLGGNKPTVNLDMKDGLGKTAQVPAEALKKAAEKGKDVVVDYGKVQLNIPAGTLDLSNLPANAKVNIAAKEVPATEADQILGKKNSAAKVAGKVFEFTITADDKNVSFSKKVKVAFTYDDSDVAGMDLDKVGVYYYNETTGEWEYVGGKIDKTTKQINVDLKHFSKYAIMEYNKSFADTQNHWAKADVELLAAKHLVKGVSADKFNPDASITRAEFAVLLQRALGLEVTAAAVASFKDVAAKDWYFNGVQAAAKAGLINGYPDGTFKPKAKISRQEMAGMMARALTLTGNGKTLTGEQVNALLAKFKDTAQIGGWAKGSTAMAVEAGIIMGRPNSQFVPLGLATRAEAATMLKRFVIKIGLI